MTGLEKLLRWHSLRGGISTQDATATGNPATFTTTLVRPLKVCKANFAPVQEGSGTPSPENVRPISGWDGLTVYHSGADTSDPEEIAVTFGTAGTVYGGTVDLVTGVLTVTHKCLTLDGDSLSDYYNSVNRPRVLVKNSLLSDVWTGNSNPQGVVMCDKARTYPNGMAIDGDNSVNPYCVMGSTMNFIFPESYGITSLSSAKTWFNSNNVTCVFRLKNDVAYQIDPQTIRTLAGANTVWSNANGNLEITYIKKG